MQKNLLNDLSLDRYDSKLYGSVRDEFNEGGSRSNFVSNIVERLEGSCSIVGFSFQSAYVVLNGNNAIGYVYISGVSNDDVYLEYSVIKQFRGNGYGSKIIKEVSDYLFENHNIRMVKLDIDPSNKRSMDVAASCDFYPDEEDFENRNFNGKMVFIKESECYESKRRNRL